LTLAVETLEAILLAQQLNKKARLGDSYMRERSAARINLAA